MDIESFKYYVFYDLETTGINPAFDQILQFAAVRTDLDFNEIDRYQYRLELRNDVIPQPGALIVNRLNINTILKGEKEYEAIKKMETKHDPKIILEYFFLEINFMVFSILLFKLGYSLKTQNIKDISLFFFLLLSIY